MANWPSILKPAPSHSSELVGEECREVMVNSVLFFEMLKTSLKDGGPVDQIGAFFLLENVREIDRGW